MSVPQARLSSGSWSFSSDDVSRLNDKIDAAGGRIDSILHLGQGMQTGRNDVFGERSEKDIQEWNVQTVHRFKRATNSDIQRYFIRDRGEYVLYLEGVSSFAELPKGVQKHLHENEAALRNRAAFKRGDCEWWKFTWPLHQECYGRKKILCPYLATTNRFALDNGSIFLGLTDTTVLFENGQPESLLYILGLLNSRLLTFRFRSIGKLKSGGIYEYFWNSISRLPIRRIDFSKKPEVAIHDEITTLVERIQQTTIERQDARSPHARAEREREESMLDERIERLVRSLYGVTGEEDALIEAEIAEAASPGNTGEAGAS